MHRPVRFRTCALLSAAAFARPFFFSLCHTRSCSVSLPSHLSPLPLSFPWLSSADLPFLSYLPSFLPLFTLQTLRRTFASAADVHLSVGDDIALQLEQAGCGPDISNWACGVDSFVFNPRRQHVECGQGSLRSRLTGGAPHAPIILYCGRVAPEKRLELLPKVALLLLERLQREAPQGSARGRGGAGASPSPPKLAFVVVGDGPALGEVKALMAELGPTFLLRRVSGEGAGEVEDGGGAWAAPMALSTSLGRSCGAIVTTFLGQVVHSAPLGGLYASSDAFFSPSTCETLGQVFQEAMASGLVPVGCRFGGVPEVFDHEGEGFLFDPEDLSAAVEGLTRALGDRAALLGKAVPFALPPTWVARGVAARGERARQRVLSKSWEAAYGQAESAYYRALATRFPYRPNKPTRA